MSLSNIDYHNLQKGELFEQTAELRAALHEFAVEDLGTFRFKRVGLQSHGS